MQATLTGHGAVVDVGHGGADDRVHVEGDCAVGGIVDGGNGSAAGGVGAGVWAHVASDRGQAGLVLDGPLRSAQRQQGSGQEEADGGFHREMFVRWGGGY